MSYVMQKSETPGWWVLTDTENRIVVRFEEHKFNDTQEVTMLEDCTLTALQAARVMRELGDWVVRHHANKVF